MLNKQRKFPAHVRKRGSRRGNAVQYRTAVVSAALLLSGLSVHAQSAVKGIKPIGGKVSVGAIPTASVLTQHNDISRTGVNPNETLIVPTGPGANLSAKNYGKIWSRYVDGTIYAQPLYVPNIQFPNVPDLLNASTTNGVYNAVFVCTTHNSIYAFDAGDSAQLTRPTYPRHPVRSLPLWKFSFNSYYISPVQTAAVDSDLLTPEIGIIGTPVIDCSTDPVTGFKKGTLFAVTKTREGLEFVQRLHSIDIRTGKEIGTPIVIAASVPGLGDGTVLDPVTGLSVVPFDPLRENQQAGLALANPGTPNATLYITWGSHSENAPYHGWVMAYNVANPGSPALLGAFNTTPNGDSSVDGYLGNGGILQSGAAPAIDENGCLFVNAGIGNFNVDPTYFSGGTEYGTSVLKLQLPTTATNPYPVQDYFTPTNWQDLGAAGTDFGTGGVLLIPQQANGAPPLAVVGSGDGSLYLLDRTPGFLGGYFAGFNLNYQQLSDIGPISGLPAYNNGTLYTQGTGDFLKAFPFQADGTLPDTPATQTTRKFGYPGATPSITTKPDGSSATVWTVERFAPPPIVPGLGIPDPAPYTFLHAYDANDVSNEVLNGMQFGTRDAGSYALFSVPTVANGRTYVGGINELMVFGDFQRNEITPKPIEADHFVISGPSSTTERSGNWYNITAVGPDGKPIKLNGTVHLNVTNGVGLQTLGALNFNDPVNGPQSSVLFNYAFPTSGFYQFFAIDDDGHSTYVPNIDLMPYGTLFETIFVGTRNSNGPDHLLVVAPSVVKEGTTVNVQVTILTGNNLPYVIDRQSATTFIPDVVATLTIPDATTVAYYPPINPPAVPITIGKSTYVVKVPIVGKGKHSLIVSGTINWIYGPITAPTKIISYGLTGSTAITAQ